MKKLAALAVGLGLCLGSISMFAQDKMDKMDDKKTDEGKKKKKGKKKTDTPPPAAK